MKRKKFFKVFGLVFAIIFCIIAVCIGAFFVLYTPTLTLDFSKTTGEVTDGASGYLYGIAEDGVPSYNMSESVDISTVSQKVAGGLQHPIGDIDNVANQLGNTKYNVVYLQDDYDTWYYANDEILAMRKDNTYSWQDFIDNDYLPRVDRAVTELSSKSYSDKIVYCLYNECDNGVWFGTTKADKNNDEYGVYGDYDKEGRKNFYTAWKLTYDRVKAINPNALIGGPGFYEYDHNKINEFMTYCKANKCVPDVMIYHELSPNSVYLWQDNVKDYRKIEKSLGISELPIIVTEYGMMSDNGNPAKMLQYITQIESSKVYADNAYWRLADNLCDVCADDNTPNSNWWLYRWYTDLQGETATVSYNDLFKSNVGKALKGEKLRSKGIMGIGTVTKEKDKIEVICGGRNGAADIKINGLEKTNLQNKTVDVYVEATVYNGLSATSNSPVFIKEYRAYVRDSQLVIQLDNLDEGSAYHIIVKEWDKNSTELDNTNVPVRYEFENGTLLGKAYTYDSAYASTGEIKGLVGGIENDGDGVEITVDASEDAKYLLEIVYGKSNDGKINNERIDGVANIQIDDKKDEINLKNTIKSEYTNSYIYQVELKKGAHTIRLTHNSGTYVLDSLLMSKKESKDVAVLKDIDRTTAKNKSFLVVAPSNGYYKLENIKKDVAYVNGIASNISNNKYVYLMRGLNYIDIKTKKDITLKVSKKTKKSVKISKKISINDAVLSDTATISALKSGKKYIDNISSVAGSAQFSVYANYGGTYLMTISYSNNDEGGTHDYNVDLIERYVTITANGVSKDVYCRNTYSWDTVKTVTTPIELNAGYNTITLTNSGNKKFNNNDTFAPYIFGFTINTP